jgi:hypothetical protein
MDTIFEKKTPQNRVYGILVHLFVFSKGPFPADSMDAEGWVSIDRLARTGRLRKEEEPCLLIAEVAAHPRSTFELSEDGLCIRLKKKMDIF